MAMSTVERALDTLRDVEKLKKRHHESSGPVIAEPISERTFVRAFGDKAKRVRYSNRADFVGLMVMGHNCGFVITKPGAKVRRLRVLGVNRDGSLKVTARYLDLKSFDSLTNLQRGLLRWVQ